MFLLKPYFKNIGALINNESLFEILQRKGASISKDSLNNYLDFNGTKQRYLDDGNENISELGAEAIRKVCEINQIKLNDVQLIIYAGVSKHYYEPTTASLIAHQLELHNVAAFDVTAACAGMSLAVQTADQYLKLNPSWKHVVIVAVELPMKGIDWQIHTENDLIAKGAGLTLSAAQAALVVSNKPQNTCIEIQEFVNHFDNSFTTVCQAPIKGSFFSESTKLVRPSLIAIKKLHQALLERYKESYSNLLVLPHQPAKSPTETMAKILGLPNNQVVSVHEHFANSVSAAWVSAYYFLMNQEEIRLKHNTPVAIFTAAGGFVSINFIGKLSIDNHE